MYEDEWSRFMKTGQVCDYLAYKELSEAENIADGPEEAREFDYAGVCGINRDNNKIRADRRI